VTAPALTGQALTAALPASCQKIWDTTPPWIASFADGTITDKQLGDWAGQCAQFCWMEGEGLKAARADRRLPPETAPHIDRLIDDTEREPAKLVLLLKELGMTLPAEPSPVCFAYGNYFRALAFSGELDKTLAALYAIEAYYLLKWRQVRHLCPAGSRSEWAVSNWTSPEFEATVDGVGNGLTAVAGPATAQTMARLVPVFRIVPRYEWMFWVMCETGDTGWPV
jgi:thiaminase